MENGGRGTGDGGRGTEKGDGGRKTGDGKRKKGALLLAIDRYFWESWATRHNCILAIKKATRRSPFM